MTKSKKTVSISSLGEVKSDVKTFDNNLDLLAGNTGLAVASTDDKMIAIEDNGKIAVQPFSHKMEVSQLAASHTVSFQGFTSASQVLASDTFAFDFGTWATNLVSAACTDLYSTHRKYHHQHLPHPADKHTC